MELVPITDKIRKQANDLIASQWSSTVMVIRGELVDTGLLDGFAAVEDDTLLSLITYRIIGRECEIACLYSVQENLGLGTLLIQKVKEIATANHCSILKLITTNDNIDAIKFYQKRGFDMAFLYHNAMDLTRTLKPAIPLTGDYDIPLKHEIEFRMELQPSQNQNDHTMDSASQMSEVKIYTDGSARGNPDGPGGYGTIISFTDSKGNTIEREFSAGFKKTTNNRMELMAAIVGLEALKKPCKVILYSDSQYLVKAFNDHWLENWIKKGWKTSQKEPVKNIDLWKRLLRAMDPHNVTFEWVRGHNGHPMNERCDVLATTAADGDNLTDDVIAE